jgi:hypothetical protein
MLLAITDCVLVAPFRLRLTFNDGLVKEVDIAAHWDKLSGPIFRPLRDPAFLRK